MGFNNDNNQNNADDLLNIISVVIGYQNLMENRQQSAHNDIEKHNQKQAKTILDDLHEKFEEQNKIFEFQNKMFVYQNHLLQEILNIIKGEKDNEL